MPNTKPENAAFSKDIHVRVTPGEYEEIVRNADKLGLTLSKYSRRIILGKKSPEGSDSDIRNTQKASVASIKKTFKKAQDNIQKILDSYERSLSLKRHDGEPAVNTEQTIRVVSGVVTNQRKIQDDLNQMLRLLGETGVHVAAKPAAYTKVGRYLDEEQDRDTRRLAETANPAAPSIKNNENEIPERFRYMLTIVCNGPIVSGAELFNVGNYEKFRFQVEAVSFVNGKKASVIYDVVSFKGRFAKIVPALTAGKSVIINGDFTPLVDSYGGVQSTANGTIDATNITLV